MYALQHPINYRLCIHAGSGSSLLSDFPTSSLLWEFQTLTTVAMNMALDAIQKIAAPQVKYGGKARGDNTAYIP